MRIGLCCELLTSCATALPRVNAIRVERMNAVIAEIKRQVSIFETEIGKQRHVSAPRERFNCGSGNIDFELVSVTMTLTTTTETSAGGSLGFSAPLAGAKLNGGRTVTNTQELKFPLFNAPVPPGYVYKGDGSNAPSPISDALLGLRASLIDGAKKPGVCFYTYNFHDPEKDEGGTYKLGLTVTDKGGASVEVGLAPVTA